MALETRAAGKAAVTAAVYSNVANEVSGDEVQARLLAALDSAIIQEAWEDVASAGTCNIGASSSNFVRITGTTTITSFGTVTAGTWRRIKFATGLTLTYNGTSLIIPGAANIVTAADDIAEVISEGSGNWRLLSYTRADSGSPALPFGTFTPTFTAAAVAPTGVTYSEQVGYYTRIGNLVFVSSRIQLTSKGTGGSGAVRLGGLPFTAANIALTWPAALQFTLVDLAAGYSAAAANIQANTTYAVLSAQGDNVANAAIQWSAIADTSLLAFAGFYQV